MRLAKPFLKLLSLWERKYCDKLKSALEKEKWVDIYENKGEKKWCL